MPITKAKKTETIEKLGKIMKEAKSLAFVNFHGLTVANATEMRRGLRAAEVGYVVAKKTLAKRALRDAGLLGEVPELAGELGIAYSGDEIGAPREAYVFQKKFEGKLALQGGVFGGKFVGQAEALALALIPSMQILRAQFVNLINSPIQGLVLALDGIARKKQ